jgi:hypothetical protein
MLDSYGIQTFSAVILLSLSMPVVCNNHTFFFRVAQPVFLGKFILFFNKNTAVTTDEAYMYAGALIITATFSMILTHHSFLACQKIGMRIRVACCSVIYRKVCFHFMFSD